MPADAESGLSAAVGPAAPETPEPRGVDRAAVQTNGLDEILSLIADGVISTNERGLIVLFNRAAEKMFGYSAHEVLGRPVEMLLPPQHRADHRRQVLDFAQDASDADGTMGHQREVSGLRKDGTKVPVEASLSRRVLAGRKILTVVLRDVRERRALEEQRRLVQAELAHRFKNMMAVVNSIVSLTARGATSVDSFRDALQGRLGAVARTQEALLDEPSRGADLEQLLSLELAPFRSSVEANIVLSGKSVELPARSAASLALAFHELATNAAKYGALSRAGAKLTVTWRVEARGARAVLSLDWLERGGPTIEPQRIEGFGSQLIARCTGGGNSRLTYEPEGLRAHLEVAL